MVKKGIKITACEFVKKLQVRLRGCPKDDTIFLCSGIIFRVSNYESCSVCQTGQFLFVVKFYLPGMIL